MLFLPQEGLAVIAVDQAEYGAAIRTNLNFLFEFDGYLLKVLKQLFFQTCRLRGGVGWTRYFLRVNQTLSHKAVVLQLLYYIKQTGLCPVISYLLIRVLRRRKLNYYFWVWLFLWRRGELGSK